MKHLKRFGAGVLLLLGFWCLGRAVETGLDRNPSRLEKRETVLAGVLLGIPATTAGLWLAMALQQQEQVEREQHLQRTFFQLLRRQQGRITPLQLAEATGISGTEAKAYLSLQARIYDGSFDVNSTGSITFCFDLEEKRLESDY